VPIRRNDRSRAPDQYTLERSPSLIEYHGLMLRYRSRIEMPRCHFELGCVEGCDISLS